MCFSTPDEPLQYAPPSAPPGSGITPVPQWMVREVMEQRHSVRTKRKKKLAVLAPGESQTSDIDADAGVVGKETLGGDS